MLLDACVLIDFLKADKAVLQLMVQYVGAFSVIGPVVDEVKEINDDNELIELGLIIMEPALEDAYAAGSQRGPLSFEDPLSLLTAKRHGLLLVTNDRRLRRECEPEGVAVLWGLELLAALHTAGGVCRPWKLWELLKQSGSLIQSILPRRLLNVSRKSSGTRTVVRGEIGYV